MERVLITGMSGTGKSAVVRELAARGHQAHDLDTPEWSFVSGCSENMERLFPLIDTIILLSAPVPTLMERLVARSRDGYGHAAEERRKIADLIATIEPLLRESADHEIDASGPLMPRPTRFFGGWA